MKTNIKKLFSPLLAVGMALVMLGKDLFTMAMLHLHNYHQEHFAAGILRNIPLTLQELQQYNVNRPGMVEANRASLYDTLAYAQAGQTQLQFFQTPKGQNGKTFADTNMTIAGSLPAPQSFLIETVELYFYPNALPSIESAANTPIVTNFINDTYKFWKQGSWLELYIGSKAYLDEAPIQKFPPRCGLSGFAGYSDAASTALTSTQTGYASNGGPVYELDPPILLVPTQNFNITLNWPTAVALSAAGTVACQLGGILYRNSQ